MITARNRDNNLTQELVCDAAGNLVVTQGPALAQAFSENGSIADTDLYLLGAVVIAGPGSGASIQLESNGDVILLAKAVASQSTYIALPAPVRCISETGLDVTVTGSGVLSVIYYYPA